MKSAAAVVLGLGMLLGASGGQGPTAGALVAAGAPIPAESATVTVPVPPVPVFVSDVSTPATIGWSAARADRRQGLLDDELLSAYSFAVAVAPERCHLSLSLLAAIGQVESGNAAGRTIDAGHRVVPAIVGPALDGSRYAAVPDTDGGLLDGDTVWDHAVGPFQFIPSSWRVAGVDFDDDGVRDPQNVYDAAGAAMVYLCAGGRDLDDPRQLDEAVLAYNHSRAYLRTVLEWKAVFDGGGLWGDATPAGYFEASPLAGPVPSRSSVSGTFGQTSHQAAPPTSQPAATQPAATQPAAPPSAAPPPAPPAVTPPADEPEPDPEPGEPGQTTDPVAEPSGSPDPCPASEEPTADPAEEVPGEQPPATETDPGVDTTPPTEDCTPVPEPTEPTESTEPAPVPQEAPVETPDP